MFLFIEWSNREFYQFFVSVIIVLSANGHYLYAAADKVLTRWVAISGPERSNHPKTKPS